MDAFEQAKAAKPTTVFPDSSGIGNGERVATPRPEPSLLPGLGQLDSNPPSQNQHHSYLPEPSYRSTEYDPCQNHFDTQQASREQRIKLEEQIDDLMSSHQPHHETGSVYDPAFADTAYDGGDYSEPIADDNDDLFGDDDAVVPTGLYWSQAESRDGDDEEQTYDLDSRPPDHTGSPHSTSNVTATDRSFPAYHTQPLQFRSQIMTQHAMYDPSLATNGQSPTESELEEQGFEFHSGLSEEEQAARFQFEGKAWRKTLREIEPTVSRKQQWHAFRQVSEEYGNADGTRTWPVTPALQPIKGEQQPGDCRNSTIDGAQQAPIDNCRAASTDSNLDVPSTDLNGFSPLERSPNNPGCSCSCGSSCQCPPGECTCDSDEQANPPPKPTQEKHDLGLQHAQLSAMPTHEELGGPTSAPLSPVKGAEVYRLVQEHLDNSHPYSRHDPADEPHPSSVDPALDSRRDEHRKNHLPDYLTQPVTQRRASKSLGPFELSQKPTPQSRPQPRHTDIRKSIEPETPRKDRLREWTPAFEDRSPSPSPVSVSIKCEDTEMTDVPHAVQLTTTQKKSKLPLPAASSPDPISSPVHGATTAPQSPIPPRSHSRSRSRSRSPSKLPLKSGSPSKLPPVPPIPSPCTPKSSKRGERRKSAGPVASGKVEKESTAAKNRATSRKVTSAVKKVVERAVKAVTPKAVTLTPMPTSKGAQSVRETVRKIEARTKSAEYTPPQGVRRSERIRRMSPAPAPVGEGMGYLP